MIKGAWAHITRGYALWEKYLTGVAGSQDAIASSGISPRLWRLNVRFWLILPLLYPIIELLQAPPAPQRLLICVSAAAGLVLPIRGAVVAVSVLMMLSAAMSIGIDGGVLRANWLQIIPLVRGLGLDMIAEDPGRCAQELTEIERVARKSLREVREAVAGYRQPRLESELEGARQLLEAAGIDYQVEALTGPLHPETSAVLAWTVREGVTNIIRHSHAQRCLIALYTLSEGDNPLTNREREVLAASLFGACLAEIAARLVLSEGTVRNHLSTAMQKLGAQNRMEAARIAEQKGWL